MTTEDNQVHQENNDAFSYLYSYEFVVLTTFRKDGREVPTTVWFAHRQGKLYITTTMTAGKIKRIRNNGRVFIAPSDRIGNLLGERIEGRAYEVPPQEHDAARQLLADKYPSFTAMISAPGLHNVERTYIEVRPI